MPVQVFAASNCDDVVIFWRIDAPIADCWGFAIERENKADDGTVTRTVLDNRVGFAADAAKSGDHRPSTEWPFQRFNWADHSVDTGDTVRYRVVPIVHDGTHLTQNITERSDWTPWMEVSSAAGPEFSVVFNRGLVISQFMARYLEKLRVDNGLATLRDALKLFKKTLDDHEGPIRTFLSGVLRTELLRHMADARAANQHLFGALYELEDDELVAEIGKFGPKAHVVLANGSITKGKHETAEAAHKRDQNKKARQALRDKNVEVHDRMVSPGALGHNKFLVFTTDDVPRKPFAVWTGSTNWSKTALCTQTNNGLFVKHDDFASKYFSQWELLRDSESAFPATLVNANTVVKKSTLTTAKADIWFTRTKQTVDLAALDEVVNAAEEAVLFLMFQPGGAATLGSIRKRIVKPGKLYVKGVVSTLPTESPDELTVATVGDDKKRSLTVDIIQPEGIKTPFASWAATVTRNDFLLNSGGVVGYAIVHSKVIVIDPFTKPVVVTGSHNFSKAASENNDENFVIIRDNKDLALEYAVHILSVYKHYRWLVYLDGMLRKHKKPFSALAETPDWQKGHLKGPSKEEIDFWVR